ncbi:unnamed protein product [Rhodiola kirilowii]
MVKLYFVSGLRILGVGNCGRQIMGSKNNPPGSRTRRSLLIIRVIGLCGVFHLLGAWQISGSGKGDTIAMKVMKETECSPTVIAGSTVDFPDVEF